MPGPCRNCIEHRKDTWARSNRWYAAGDTSATTREELTEIPIFRCAKHITKSKTNLDGTSCEPNTVSPEVEKGGCRWQNRQVPGQPPVPYKPRLHMAGWLRQGHPRIHIPSLLPTKEPSPRVLGFHHIQEETGCFYRQIC